MDKIGDLFQADTELTEKFLPKYNEAGLELRRHDANAEDGKKRRIWPRNHLALICAQEAAKKLGNNALIRFASRRYEKRDQPLINQICSYNTTCA